MQVNYRTALRYLPPAAIRELDRRAIEDFGVPGIVLMENAGRGCAEFIAGLKPAGSVVICCGRGNNGGDGFVIARHLDRLGIAVEVLLFADPADLRGDALVNYEIVHRAQIPLTLCADRSQPQPAWLPDVSTKLNTAALIVDALLGTGTTGEPRFPLNLVIDAINAARKPTIAIDLPSGLDATSGGPAKSTVQATHTLTFVAPKSGFAAIASRECLGQVHVLDIGAPRVLVEAIMRENPPRPTA
jgi:NAD(P)H-hydrate epimerase